MKAATCYTAFHFSYDERKTHGRIDLHLHGYHRPSISLTPTLSLPSRYAGEEAETEAESVIDGHYVAAPASQDAAGAESHGAAPHALGALKDTRGGGVGATGGRGVVAETGMIGAPRRGEAMRDRNGPSASSASTAPVSAGLTGLNEILDVNNAAPRRRSGVRLRTNLLKT